MREGQHLMVKQEQDLEKLREYTYRRFREIMARGAIRNYRNKLKKQREGLANSIQAK